MPVVYRNRKPGRGNEIPIELTPEQAQRFWCFVEEVPSGCWEWIGSFFADFGYGQYRVNGRYLATHRVSWTLVRAPIQQGMTLDHLCRNPKCVNPDHLEVVTNRENILRGESFSAKNAVKTHCKHGHEFTPENTRIWSCRGKRSRSCLQCQRARYKVRQVKKDWRSGKRKPKTQEFV